MLSPLTDLAIYQHDAEDSLRLYYSAGNPYSAIRFTGYSSSELASELGVRLSETEMRSALVVMARVEAAFRIDYSERLQRKKTDPISVTFRKISRTRKTAVRLDEDIWTTWRTNLSDPAAKSLISQLRSVFKFRHWIAHGRYWPVGNKYDFQTIYALADTALASFPFFE